MPRPLYLTTTTNPDDIDDTDGFGAKLETCKRFRTKRGAESHAREFSARTNATIFVLRVEVIASVRGKLDTAAPYACMTCGVTAPDADALAAACARKRLAHLPLLDPSMAPKR